MFPSNSQYGEEIEYVGEDVRWMGQVWLLAHYLVDHKVQKGHIFIQSGEINLHQNKKHFTVSENMIKASYPKLDKLSQCEQDNFL